MFEDALLKKLVIELDSDEPTGIRPEAAANFASLFGPINVMTFEDGKCLHPTTDTTEAVAEFVARHAEADLYFQPAIRRDDKLGKAKRDECLGSHWVWADIDPPKAMKEPEDLRRWRRETLEGLAPVGIPEPQIVVMSGRGLWLFWRLSMLIPTKEVEAINRGLAEILGGDHVQNVDRVARLPFTRNTKTGMLARVLHHVEGTTDAHLLPVRVESAVLDSDPPELHPPRPIHTIEDFRKVLSEASLSKADRDRLELAALDPVAANDARSEPLDTSDRSAVMFSWTMSALKAGLPPAAVRDCILLPTLGPISAHILDPQKVPAYARERYAKRQIENAQKKLGLRPHPSASSPDLDPDSPPTVVSLAPVPADLPPRPWLVEGLLMDGQVTMITGKGGEGKSLLALQLGAMIAAGEDSPSGSRRPLATCCCSTARMTSTSCRGVYRPQRRPWGSACPNLRGSCSPSVLGIGFCSTESRRRERWARRPSTISCARSFVSGLLAP